VGVKPSQVAGLKPKSKCCREKVRCLKCPVVVMHMRRAEAAGMHGKDLKKALKRARAV
jgi:hypothetical protein